MVCLSVSLQGMSHWHGARALLAYCMHHRLSLSVYGQSLTDCPALPASGCEERDLLAG